MTLIDQTRLSMLPDLRINEGGHDDFSEGHCAMELVAWLANEPWSDAPQCACPTITAFMVSWNDSLPSDEDRDRLLKPLLPEIIGTRSTDEIAKRRSCMAIDWLIRAYAPRWLDLIDELKPHAKALRDIDEIVDLAGVTAAGELTRAARTAARTAAGAAAWDTARDAARDAAGDAAWDAAWTAARDAAGAAARAAARAAAGDAAGAAARAAARAAAGDAAGAALKPTTEWLQASAQDLVRRMCALDRFVAEKRA